MITDVERQFAALDGMLEGRQFLVGDGLSYADLAVIGQLNALLDADEGAAAMAKTKHVQPWTERLDAIAPKEKPQ